MRHARRSGGRRVGIARKRTGKKRGRSKRKNIQAEIVRSRVGGNIWGEIEMAGNKINWIW